MSWIIVAFWYVIIASHDGYSFTDTNVMRLIRLKPLVAVSTATSHKIKQPRDLVFNVLTESVEKRKEPMDVLSQKLQSVSKLFDQRDRNHIKHLVGLVVRREGQVKKIISRYLKKAPHGRIRPVFLGCLQLATSELVFTNNTSHGIVSSTMNYFHGMARFTQSYCSLLNAVLRKISSDRDALIDSTR